MNLNGLAVAFGADRHNIARVVANHVTARNPGWHAQSLASRIGRRDAQFDLEQVRLGFDGGNAIRNQCVIHGSSLAPGTRQMNGRKHATHAAAGGGFDIADIATHDATALLERRALFRFEGVQRGL